MNRSTDPKLFLWNSELAKQLNVCDEWKDDAGARAEIFSGNRILPGSEPLAMAYAGHQFGNFVPQLNDIEYIAQTQDVLLVIAMAAIGTKIFYKDLLVSGPKALKLGTLIFIFQILFIALFIFIKNGMNY